MLKAFAWMPGMTVRASWWGQVWWSLSFSFFFLYSCFNAPTFKKKKKTTWKTCWCFLHFMLHLMLSREKVKMDPCVLFCHILPLCSAGLLARFTAAYGVEVCCPLEDGDQIRHLPCSTSPCRDFASACCACSFASLDTVKMYRKKWIKKKRKQEKSRIW